MVSTIGVTLNLPYRPLVHGNHSQTTLLPTYGIHGTLSILDKILLLPNTTFGPIALTYKIVHELILPLSIVGLYNVGVELIPKTI